MNRRSAISTMLKAAGAGFAFNGLIYVPRAQSQQVVAMRRRLSPPAAGAGLFTGDLVDENCEGGATPDGWTDTGTVNWNYTTTVLQGAKSVLFNSTASYKTFTGQTTVEGYCLNRRPSLPVSTITIFGFRDSGGSVVCVARMNSSGALSVFRNAADSNFTVGTIAANQTVHIWLRYVQGGTCTVAWSTDGVRPTSGNNFTSASHTGTATAARFDFTTSASICDRMIASTTAIPDNP